MKKPKNCDNQSSLNRTCLVEALNSNLITHERHPIHGTQMWKTHFCIVNRDSYEGKIWQNKLSVARRLVNIHIRFQSFDARALHVI